MLKEQSVFWLCFIPFFIAVDALGVMPMFVALTQGVEKQKIKNIVFQSVVTAMVVAVLFLFAGRVILKLLGIQVADFMIAGGVLLFFLSVNDILTTEKRQRAVDLESMGSVPIGVPLVVGPAVLTTSFLLVDIYGPWIPVAALVVNIAIAGALFLLSGPIYSRLGKSGAKTISKLSSILLAAIAVMMVRKGIYIYIDS